MWQLTEDNAAGYVRERGWVTSEARVEALSGGVSNVVLRVEHTGGRFVLKQSRPQLLTREAWFSDIERVYREQEVMEILQPLLPGVVPAVLFADRERYVFAMEHAPIEARVWKPKLLNGELDDETARRAGGILGTIHERTCDKAELRDRLGDRSVFVQLRVEPFYRRVQQRHADLASAIEPLVEGMMTANEALCHGDFSPKNLLVSSGGVVLVDHETAHYGEPAMDVGFFFSHLILKGLRGGPAFRGLIRAAWEGYASAYRRAAESLERGYGHLGVCLLARVDGTSPVDYLDDAQRERARAIGRGLLARPCGRVLWDLYDL